MADVKISVIVPVYNLEKELPRCLESILAQTHRNLEVIAVDDGSSDGSREVLTEFAARDSRVMPVFKENGGVTSARLRGVAESSGDWIGFVDGDDEIEPDMYERLLANAEKYGADISHCGYRMVFADGRVHYFHNTGLLAEQDQITGLRDLLSGSKIEPGLCNKLFHKNLFHSLLHGGVMPTDIRINEDLLMNYWLFSAAQRSVFEDWCPYHYIVRGTSASRSKLNEHRIYDPVRVKRIILEDVPDELLPDARRAYVNTCVYSYCGLVLEKDYPVAEAKKKLRSLLKAQKAWCPLLPKRTGLLAELIIKMPRLFAAAYPLYVRFLQKRRYD